MCILIVALLLEAVGVVLLSKGLKEIGTAASFSVPEIWRIIKAGLGNPTLLTGIALETVFFGVLLYLLSQREVSLIWPLTSLGFVISTAAAKIVLAEEVSPLRWAGVALIVVGAGFITYSEKQKERARSVSTESAAPSTAQDLR
ncbi:MAG: hypothetical protein H7X97_08940 [Opitutaceae bacterium]|nr:hypothetical protein [Verrucomicrobiales bacterium]